MNKNLIRKLGAKVAETLCESVTHFICSKSSLSKNPKRARAADLMDIPVVTPLWIQRCQEAGSKVDEVDYLLLSKSPAESATVPKKDPVKEPVEMKAAACKSVDSSHFCSSSKKLVPKPTTAPIESIPLPSFRERPPLLHEESALTKQSSRRRSERISEYKSDSDESCDYDTQGYARSTRDASHKLFQRPPSETQMPPPRRDNRTWPASSTAFALLEEAEEPLQGEEDGKGQGQGSILGNAVLPVVFFSENGEELSDGQSRSDKKEAAPRKGKRLVKGGGAAKKEVSNPDPLRSTSAAGNKTAVSSGAQRHSSEPLQKESKKQPARKDAGRVGRREGDDREVSTAPVPVPVPASEPTAKKPRLPPPHSASSSSSSSSSSSLAPPAVQVQGWDRAAFMLTGFNAKTGERDTIAETLKAVIRAIQERNLDRAAEDSSTSCSKSKGGKRKAAVHAHSAYLHLLEETSPAILLEEDPPQLASLLSFSHLVACSSSHML